MYFSFGKNKVEGGRPDYKIDYGSFGPKITYVFCQHDGLGKKKKKNYIFLHFA